MQSFRDSGPFSCPHSLLGFLTQVLSIPSASAQRNRMENPMWIYFLCLEMMSFLYTHSLLQNSGTGTHLTSREAEIAFSLSAQEGKGQQVDKQLASL